MQPQACLVLPSCCREIVCTWNSTSGPRESLTDKETIVQLTCKRLTCWPSSTPTEWRRSWEGSRRFVPNTKWFIWATLSASFKSHCSQNSPSVSQTAAGQKTAAGRWFNRTRHYREPTGTRWYICRAGFYMFWTKLTVTCCPSLTFYFSNLLVQIISTIDLMGILKWAEHFSVYVQNWVSMFWLLLKYEVKKYLQNSLGFIRSHLGHIF